MSKAKLKIGVIGLGRIGWRFHCATLAKHAEFELVGVADPECDRRAEAEREYQSTSVPRAYNGGRGGASANRLSAVCGTGKSG